MVPRGNFQPWPTDIQELANLSGVDATLGADFMVTLLDMPASIAWKDSDVDLRSAFS